MSKISQQDAGNYACPFNNFDPCMGSRCMAWAWIGAPSEHRTTNNLVITEEGERPGPDAPKPPEGEGWLADGAPYSTGYHRSKADKLPPATAQRWVKSREVTEGRCGRTAPDDRYGNDW